MATWCNDIYTEGLKTRPAYHSLIADGLEDGKTKMKASKMKIT